VVVEVATRRPGPAAPWSHGALGSAGRGDRAPPGRPSRPDHRRDGIALADGARCRINALLAQSPVPSSPSAVRGIHIPVLIDLTHVLGHLWNVANATLTDQLAAWREDQEVAWDEACRLVHLLAGDSQHAAGFVRGLLEAAQRGWSGSRRPGGASRRCRRSTPRTRAPPSSALRCIHPDRRSLIEPAYLRGLLEPVDIPPRE
jgi:hypothetical protein